MLLINANVLPIDAPPIPRGYVRLEKAQIVEVGSMDENPLPLGEESCIDLDGKLLLPGFVDAHSHLGLMETGLGVEGDDINEDTDPCTPHLRAIDAINPMDPAFADARQAGVTCAVIGPGSTNPIAGQICAVKTNGRWIDKMILSAPLAIKFALGENPKMAYGARPQTPITRMGIVAIIREQLARAQRYLADCQHAEEEEDIDPPEFDAKCEALVPLLKREISAHFHAHKAYDILSAVRIANEFSLRYTVIHGTESHLIADILASENAQVVCGPMMGARTKPELSGMSAENCNSLKEAGVSFAISTDHPELPVEYLLMSASVACANGLSNEDALHAITLGAAKSVGIAHRVGSITKGKDADLLVFDDDLFAVGAKPVMVFIDGVQVK